MWTGCADKGGADSGGTDTGGGTSETPRVAPEPPAWAGPASADLDVFPFPLRAGDPLPGGVLLTVQGEADEVEILVVGQDGDGWSEVQRHTAVALVDGHAELELTDLEADRAHCVVAVSPAGAHSAVTRFRTALGDGGWRVMRIGASSCFGPDNEPFPSMEFVGAETLDAFFLLGDTVYADGAISLEQYGAVWRRAMGQAGLMSLFQATGFTATWDDHEVGNNWDPEAISAPRLAAAEQAFRTHIPQREGQGRHSIWRSLRWGDVLEVFVLDSRGERTATDYISAEQMAWLKAGLTASQARFKIILNSVPISNLAAFIGEAIAEDRWQGFPVQREEILGHIVDGGIEGVLWLSGDLHHGMVGRIDPEGDPAWEQWEVLAGPGGSFINPAAVLYLGNEQFPVMLGEWGWTLLELDPGMGTIALRFIGDDGADLVTHTLQL
jgi:phosphodiesterase/alkaline phosphatase D-like protein